MGYEITGKLVAKYDTVQRTEIFKTREFAIEMTEENNGKTYTSFAKFQCVQDKTALLDDVSIGSEINVMFNVKGSKWDKDGKTNYITNLDAWKIEVLSSGPQSAPLPGKAPELPDTNDLPF